MSKSNLVHIFLVFFFACQQNQTTIIEKETNRTFLSGEWSMEKDSTKGISVRKGILGFFENWKITADSIYTYKIIDSLRITNTSEINISTYIKRMSARDTLYSEIIEHNDSTIILRKKQVLYTYRLTQ